MKSIFFHFPSVLVVAFVVASCAGQSNRATPSGAGAAQGTQSGSSNSQVTDCSVWLPGDGTGVTVAQANAHNAAVKAATACNGSAASGYAPHNANPPSAPSGAGSAGPFTAGGYEVYQQGANSVADLNVHKRDGMVNSALRNWQAPMVQEDATTTLAQNTSLEDPFANAPSIPDSGPSVRSQLDSAVDSASDADEPPASEEKYTYVPPDLLIRGQTSPTTSFGDTPGAASFSLFGSALQYINELPLNLSGGYIEWPRTYSQRPQPTQCTIDNPNGTLPDEIGPAGLGTQIYDCRNVPPGVQVVRFSDGTCQAVSN